MFEKFFGKIKKFFKKSDSLKNSDDDGNNSQNFSNEQSDKTLGNVSGGQGNMPPDPHRSK